MIQVSALTPTLPTLFTFRENICKKFEILKKYNIFVGVLLKYKSAFKF